jgi:hypothetical protein
MTPKPITIGRFAYDRARQNHSHGPLPSEEGKAVKDQWRAQRKHWVWCEPNELVSASRDHFDEHQAELIEKAKIWLRSTKIESLKHKGFLCAYVMLRKDRNDYRLRKGQH